MSVATKNPFAVLDEDSASRPPSPPPAPAAASAPAKSTSPPSNRGNQRGKGGPASRGGRYYSRGGGANKTGDANREAATTEDPAVAAEGTKRRFDGERRDGRGRGRGGRGGGGGGGRGRAFDRHSATGKTDSGKKVHQSWGGDDGNTELKVEEAANNDAAAESSNINDWAGGATGGDGAPGGDDAWGTPAAEETAPAPVDGEVEKTESRRRDKEEEEDNTLTFDQYLAQQKEKDSPVVPKLETRKANEGVDDSLWDGATVLQKGEEDTYFAGKVTVIYYLQPSTFDTMDLQTKSAPKARTEKKEKVFLEIEARFERPSRGARGRGGDRGERGRGRGGRGRGRGGANGSGSAVNVDDETAFPSLS
ncbi:hypothetical protein ID866_2145 [Astraeus odoratus]|nr:hypothetical protein ID866_2145 [Astraeus odoratus]